MSEESQLYSQRATNNPTFEIPYYIFRSLISIVHVSGGNPFCAIILFRHFDMLKLVFYVLLANTFCPINDMDFHCRVKVEFSPARPSLHCFYFIYAVNAILGKKLQ